MTDDDLELGERLCAITRDLVQIPSTDSRPEERARCFSFLRNHLESLPGIGLDEFVSNGYASIVARPAGAGQPVVLLTGHLDVVEHARREDFRSEVRDGRIVGPGTGDMKGALAIMLELFCRLQREASGSAPIALAVTSDEERGGEDGIRHLFEREGFRCGCVILPDGGSLNDVTVEEKGILHVRLVSRGRAAHAARPWLADNALERLTEQLSRFGSAFAFLPDDGSPVSAPPEGGSDHWFPTCAVTTLHCPNAAINAVPDEASATLDIRFTPPHTAQSMLDFVRENIDPGIEVERLVSAEPTHLAPDPDFLAATERVTGRPVRRVRASGGSDARFIREAGIPVMLSRPLVGNLHAVDEWVDIASMVVYYRICEDYIRRKCHAAGAEDAAG